VYFAKNVAYFPFNSWLSFQPLYRLLSGYHFYFVDSNHASNNSCFFLACVLILVSKTSATAMMYRPIELKDGLFQLSTFVGYDNADFQNFLRKS